MARAKAKIELVSNKRTVADWSKSIGGKWARTIDAVLETAAELALASEELDAGEFVQVLTNIGMSPRTAAKLVKIGGDARIANRMRSGLPRDMDTLLELARMPDDEWQLAEEAGLIREDLTRPEVNKWRRSLKGITEQEDVERVATAGADGAVEIDENAQEAFKREARLHGMLDYMRRFLDEVDPNAVALEIDRGMQAMVIPQLNDTIARMQSFTDILRSIRRG